MDPMQIETKLMKLASSLEIMTLMAAADETGIDPPSRWAMTGALNDLTLVLSDLESEYARTQADLRAIAGGA